VRTLAPLLVALLVAGCLDQGGGSPTPTPAAPPALEPLAMRTLERGSFSGVHHDAREIVRDAAEWDALWAEHRANESAPAVDFAREMVLAVVVHGPTGCGMMHLANATYDAGAGTITTTIVLEIAPQNVQCLVAFEDVFHFVAVPAREGGARWVEAEEEQSTQATPTAPTSEPATGNYSFRTLAQGSMSGVQERTRRVIPDEATWLAFWADHTSGTYPAPDPPAVDWEHERAFVALAGDKPNTCWSIAVERIDAQPSNVTVQVRTKAPPSGAMCGDAITQPFHFVTYPVTDAPLRLVEVA